MTVSVQDRLKGLLAIVALASGWAALVSLVLIFSGTIKTSEGSFAGKLLLGLMLGPLMGGTLALAVHSFLARVLDWLSKHIPFAGWFVLLLVKLPYYCFAWPGIRIGEALGIVRFAPTGAVPDAERAPDRDASTALARCPFEGTVYGNEARSKMLFRIRPDWKVDLEQQRDWGYIDAQGHIRRYTGPRLSLGETVMSPYESGYDPSAPWVVAAGDVIARVKGELCLNDAYSSDVIGTLTRGDGGFL